MIVTILMFSFNNTKPFLFVDFETQMVINSQDEVFFSLIAIASQLTLECFSLLFNALEIDEFKFLFTDVYARSTLSCIGAANGLPCIFESHENGTARHKMNKALTHFNDLERQSGSFTLFEIDISCTI